MAVFRKGCDVIFIAEELKAVFDPRGGYFKAGGVYMPSIVAEVGAVIEQHMKNIGLIHDPDHGRGAEEADRREACRVRGGCGGEEGFRSHDGAEGREQCQRIPARGDLVRQVQYAGAGADGWLPDLFELWVFEVRVKKISLITIFFRMNYSLFSQTSES